MASPSSVLKTLSTKLPVSLIRAKVSQPYQIDDCAVRGTLLIGAGRACSYSLGYLATVLLARSLGPVDYGLYGVIISVLVWVEQIGRFTFAPAAAKLIPERDRNSASIEQTAIFLNLILFFILFALLWIAGPFLAKILQIAEGTALFRIAALDLPFFGAYVLYLGLLQGRREFAPIGVADSLYSTVKLIGVLFLLAFWLSVPAALIVNVLASVGGFLFVMSRVSMKSIQPENSLIVPMLRLALPLGLFMAALQIVGVLDLWCLKALNPIEDVNTVGVYVAARSIALVPSFVLIAVSDVLLPSLSRALAMKDAGLSRHYLQQAVRFLWTVALPVTLLIALTAEELTTLLFSEIYREGGQYLRLKVFSAAFLAFIALFASALNARGEPLVSGAAVFLLVPVALLLNLFLIPRYGAFGAAWSSILSGLIGAMAFGALAYRRFGSLIRLRTILNTSIAALLMAGLATQFMVTGPLLLVFYLGYMAIYGLLLFLVGELAPEDLKLLAFWRYSSAPSGK
jgi:O-antigen/teichoic acid export membrane protein